ncbi:Olfactory receptor 14A16 [Varanus komodoensis]|nr:Olfactory receptor 14A16 [Varanus komodoensis]
MSDSRGRCSSPFPSQGSQCLSVDNFCGHVVSMTKHRSARNAVTFPPEWQHKIVKRDMANQSLVTEFQLLGFSEIWELKIVYFMSFLFMYMVAVVGNLLIIIVVALNHQLQTPMYFFLVNLAVVDLGFISATILKAMADSLMKTARISFSECLAETYFLLLFGGSEFFLLTLMAYDRYVAICNPLNYVKEMNRETCIKMATSAWIFGLFDATLNTACTFTIAFCSNSINQFFCEIPQLLRLSCSNSSYRIEIGALIFSVLHDNEQDAIQENEEHIMRKVGLDESPVGIKIAGRNINNLRYADDTTLMAESEEELKNLLMQVKEESAKVGLKLNIKKTKIMASGPLTSWQIDGEEMEVVTDFIFLGSKITADRNCSQEMKRCLLLGRKAMANLDSILKRRDITLPTKVRIVKAMVFLVAMYGCESWTIRKAERQRIEAFELWCWRRLLWVP